MSTYEMTYVYQSGGNETIFTFSPVTNPEILLNEMDAQHWDEIHDLDYVIVRKDGQPWLEAHDYSTFHDGIVGEES